MGSTREMHRVGHLKAEYAVPGFARVRETFIGKCHAPSTHFSDILTETVRWARQN